MKGVIGTVMVTSTSIISSIKWHVAESVIVCLLLIASCLFRFSNHRINLIVLSLLLVMIIIIEIRHVFHVWREKKFFPLVFIMPLLLVSMIAIGLVGYAAAMREFYETGRVVTTEYRLTSYRDCEDVLCETFVLQEWPLFPGFYRIRKIFSTASVYVLYTTPEIAVLFPDRQRIALRFGDDLEIQEIDLQRSIGLADQLQNRYPWFSSRHYWAEIHWKAED